MLIVDTKNAPGAIGPYSQAYETNGLVITSGQLPVNPADGTMPEGIAAQAGAFAPGKSVLFLPVRSGCFKHLSQKTVWFFSIPPKKFHLHPA